MKLKINSAGLAHALKMKVDDVIDIDDKNGVPLDREWRNRLKDSEIDKCVSIVTDKGGKK